MIGLYPGATFEILRAEGSLPISAAADAETYLVERQKQIEETIAIVAARAEAGTLPDAAIRDGALTITPIKDETARSRHSQESSGLWAIATDKNSRPADGSECLDRVCGLLHSLSFGASGNRSEGAFRRCAGRRGQSKCIPHGCSYPKSVGTANRLDP